MSSETRTDRLSIRIEIEQRRDDKKRVSVYLDPDFAEALAKAARLSGSTQGEILQENTLSAWAAPLGSGRFRLRKQ